MRIRYRPRYSRPILSTVILALSFCSPGSHSEIMSWEEYAELSVSPPCVVRLAADSGRLYYFGAEHSTDVTHPQVANIQDLWNECRPTMAFIEGGVWPLEESVAAAVACHGEGGLVRFLANRDAVPVQGLDPSRKEEAAFLLKRYPARQVKLFYVLRQVVQYGRAGREESFEDFIVEVLNFYTDIPGLDGPPRTVSELERCFWEEFPLKANWKEIPSTWFDPTRSEEWTNEVNKTSSRFRDEYMVRLLSAEVRRGARVFAVAGFSHVVMQERALRELLR